MARRVIDLSQPLSRESQLHPFFAPTQILRHIHPCRRAGGPAVVQRGGDRHLEPRGDPRRRVRPLHPGAATIAEMPLDTFCGDAICVDIREYPRRPRRDGRRGRARRRGERARSCAGRHPPLLLGPLQPHSRHAGVPRRLRRDLRGGRALDGGPRREDLRRRDDRPDLVYLTDEYPTHRACAERGLTHYENLNNLKDVVGQRFLFVGSRCASCPRTARRCGRPRSWRTEMSRSCSTARRRRRRRAHRRRSATSS